MWPSPLRGLGKLPCVYPACGAETGRRAGSCSDTLQGGEGKVWRNMNIQTLLVDKCMSR